MRSRLTLALLLLYALSIPLPLFAGRIPATLIVAANIIPAALFALVHGTAFYRTRGILMFTAICLIVGNAIENLGVATGFPFGRYLFTTGMGPKLFLVPILMGPAYLGIGYLSWILARIIILRNNQRTRFLGPKAFTVPLLAAVIMTSWDLTVDPTLSTLGRYWIWLDGGPYFGVPLSNFFGWLLTNYLIYQLFVFYLRLRPPTRILARSYWRLPIIFYAVVALGNVLRAIPVPGSPGSPGSPLNIVTDAAGAQWRVTDINLASAVVSILLMGTFVVLASLRLYPWREPLPFPAPSALTISDVLCPDCNLEMDQIDKTTFTGRDMREYQCPRCKRTQIVDRGKALWQILSEANEANQKDDD